MQINGSDQKSVFLCEECARNQGIPVSADDAPGVAAALDDTTGSPKAESECPSCDTKLSDFIRTGRLGCPECYLAFAPEIETLQREARGLSPHAGKKYRTPVRESGKDDLSTMRVELAAAINKEEFERAALLRDAIRRLYRTEPQ
jgi:protein arginine kinase activator